MNIILHDKVVRIEEIAYIKEIPYFTMVYLVYLKNGNIIRITQDNYYQLIKQIQTFYYGGNL